VFEHVVHGRGYEAAMAVSIFLDGVAALESSPERKGRPSRPRLRGAARDHVADAPPTPRREAAPAIPPAVVAPAASPLVAAVATGNASNEVTTSPRTPPPPSRP
jgi:hypothetical protein